MLLRDFNVVIILFLLLNHGWHNLFLYSLIHARRGSSKRKIIVNLQLMHYTQMILYNTVKPSTEGKMLEGHPNSQLIISTYLCTYENTSWPKGTESRPLVSEPFFQDWLLWQTEAKQETSEQCYCPFLFNILYLLVITIKRLMLQLLLFFHLRWHSMSLKTYDSEF